MVDDEVDPVPAFQGDPLIDQGHRALSFDAQTSRLQLPADARLVRGLEQTGTKVPVTLDHRSDALLRKSPESPSLLPSLFHPFLVDHPQLTLRTFAIGPVIDIRAR